MSIVFERMKQFIENQSSIALLELLSLDSYTDSEYRTVMYLCIEHSLKIKEIISNDEGIKNKLLLFSTIKTKYPPVIEYFNNLFINHNINFNIKPKPSIDNQPKLSHYIIKEKKSVTELEEIINNHDINNNQLHNANISKDDLDNSYEIIISQFKNNDNYKEYLLNQTIKLFHCFSKKQKHQLSKIFYTYFSSIDKEILHECFFNITEITEGNMDLNTNFANYYAYFNYASFHSYSPFANHLYFMLIYIYMHNCYSLDENTISKMIICFEFTEIMHNEKCPLTFGERNELIINNKNIKEIKEKKIFPISKINDYKSIMEIITHFYHLPMDKTLLFKESNINFIIGICDLYYYNKNNIVLKPLKYQKNLKTLEKDIILNYLAETNNNKNISKCPFHDKDEDGQNNIIIETIELNNTLKYIYRKLINTIRESMNHILTINRSNVLFTPFGSVTQLLSGKNADLDIYFKITTRDLNAQSEIINQLVQVIKQIDKMTEVIVPFTSRLCLIKFTYLNTKVDLNYFGICSVIGGCLLREYSLYDVRFPILGITIKYLLKKYEINHSHNSAYLNSFSWMLLLLTFLQDIIKPPVLPKILNKDIRKIYNLNVKRYCSKIEDVPFSLESQKFALVSSVDQLKMNNVTFMKNCMSCSELLLKFLEFIGFYWNYETIYANTRSNNQCYQNKKDIKKQYKDDKLFVTFYNEVFLKKQTIKDTLICEPFDHRYNPAKNTTESNMKDLINKIKGLYYQMIETRNL